MYDVFISYSHKDKYIADGICANFEANSVKCWYAPRDIKPGEEWSDAIMSALERSKVFILVFSKHSNNSIQVYNEITTAVKNGCHIIPFCVDSVEMKKRMAYYLNGLHWLDATDNDLLHSIELLYNEVYNILNSRQPKDFISVPFKKKKITTVNVPVVTVLLFAAVLFVFFFAQLRYEYDSPQKSPADIGSIIEFGTIDDTPIQWTVLDKKGERLLVVSREGLYSTFYNMHSGICTWESCTLRSELNSRYYDLWFTEKEKENIFETHLANEGNPVYGTEGGNATYDRLFILSYDEIMKYLPEAEDRKLMTSGYGISNYYPWWVRNPGKNLKSAVYVDEDGNISYENSFDMIEGVGNALAGVFQVRPAMWLEYDGFTKEKAPDTSAEIDYPSLYKAQQGDIVSFGRYEQDNNVNNGKEKIKWIVLETAEYDSFRKLTLMSKDCLDDINITSYNHGYNLWYDCVARNWLNGKFYTEAFSSEERKMITPTLVKTIDDTRPSSEPVSTSDNVVFMSLEQYEQYSHLPKVRDFSPSKYAIKQNNNIDGWWLIDEGSFSENNYIVNSDGEVVNSMQKFNQYIRPVINVIAYKK